MYRPSGVGIHAMEVYFPRLFVKQSDLERYDNVSKGKYTVGLGQEGMSFCDENEDINSVTLTAVHNLMEKYGIGFNDIGRIEVGTETIVDKSKAVKTTLMRLFQQHQNFDIEGVDSKNACYGLTQALLNSLAWVESSAWDGRYAIAVGGDIAVYEKGPARPTGGVGVVAMLIGRDAPLRIETPRHTHMEDVFDFYKPTLTSEYPRVDGHLSNACYLRALDYCYGGYARKFLKSYGLMRFALHASTCIIPTQGHEFTQNDMDYAVFHAPYNKLVQKSFSRYSWHDFLASQRDKFPQLEQFRSMPAEESYTSKELMTALRNVSKDDYETKVSPSELITKQCGNSYCGSLYAGLLSLIANEADNMIGKRVMMFSYGSGLAATQFSIKVDKSVQRIRDVADVKTRLSQRTAVDPHTYSQILEGKEKSLHRYDIKVPSNSNALFKGTYFLTGIDGMERRSYARAFSTVASSLQKVVRKLPK